MPSKSPRKGNSRHSDPSNASLTPLTGAFSRLSTSSRAQSLSPRKKDAKQALHVRMNLTETQMNKVTDASVDGNSPTKNQEPRATMRTHKSSSSKQLSTSNVDFSETDGHQSDMTTFEDLMPLPTQHASTISLAERRKRSTPAPICISDARRFVKAIPQRARMESVPNVVSPLNPREMYNADRTQESQSSYYPSEHHSSQQPEPLNVRHSQEQNDRLTPLNPFEPYGEWLANPDHPKAASPHKQPHRSKSTVSGLKCQSRDPSTSPEKRPQDMGLMDTPAFSPFPYYFRGEDFPSERKGQKILIGEKGWLERTDSFPDRTKKGAKKIGFIDGIKKIAKDMTDQYHPGRRVLNETVERETAKAQVTVTLNAREQSLLYCELEFNLCNSLDIFIKIQFDKGRVDHDKLKNVGDGWVKQGRPRVVGFRYDLETQLELIELHIADFVFSGRRQGNPTEISALLYTMKVNARAMRIKTFCWPDSVIAKQLVDSQSLFNMIGASYADNYSLEECAHFYKKCMEREAAKQTKATKNMRMSRAEGFVHLKGCESRRDGTGHGEQVNDARQYRF